MPVGFSLPLSAEWVEQIEAKPLGVDMGLGFPGNISSKEDTTRWEWLRGVLGMDRLVVGLCSVIFNPFENMDSPAGYWAPACMFPPAVWPLRGWTLPIMAVPRGGSQGTQASCHMIKMLQARRPYWQPCPAANKPSWQWDSMTLSTSGDTPWRWALGSPLEVSHSSRVLLGIHAWSLLIWNVSL